MLSNAYIFDDTVIGAKSSVEKSILGAGVTVGEGSVLESGCLVGDGVVLGKGTRLPAFSRVSRRREEVEEAEEEEEEEEQWEEIERCAYSSVHFLLP